MSLFGGLFGSAAAKSSLFSEANKFKTHEQEQPTEEIAADLDEQHRNKKRKKDKHDTADASAEQAADPAASKLAAGIAAAKAAGNAAETAAATAGAKNKRQKIAGQQEKQQQQKQKDKVSKQTAKDMAASSAVADAGKSKQQKKQQTQQPNGNQTDQKQPQLQKHRNEAADEQATAPQQQQQQQNSLDSGNSETDTESGATAAVAQPKTQQEQASLEKQQEDPAAAAEKLARTIFVGNLPVTIKRKAVARLFAAYGAVDSVRLRSVPLDLESQKKLPRKAAVIKGVVSADRGGANAYVVFTKPEAATAALAANMTEVEGHHIRVDRATPPASAAAGSATGVMYDPVRSVFVGNLDFKVTEEDLIRAFSNGEAQPDLAGAVEAVRVVRDAKTNIGKGIAYVLFKSKAAARAALQLDGDKLRERPMRVSRVDKKASAGSAAAVRPGGKFDKNKGSKFGGKFAGKGAAGGKLGVGGGRVQKVSGSAAAADWQGLRTKGKGSGFRAAKGSKAAPPAAARGGSRTGGGQGKGRSPAGKGKPVAGGKRPAVAARKAAAKAAAVKAAKGTTRKAEATGKQKQRS